VNYNRPISRGLPNIYVAQHKNQEGSGVFQGANPGEGAGHGQFLSGRLRQHGMRNDFSDALLAHLTKAQASSPLKIWKDTRDQDGDEEGQASFSKSPKSGGWTGYAGSPQKAKMPHLEREQEPRRQYGGFFGADAGRVLLGGRQIPVERMVPQSEWPEGICDIGSLALWQAQQQVAVELTAKSFWRRQVQ
jgi:hypothetical protein